MEKEFSVLRQYISLSNIPITFSFEWQKVT